MKVTPKHKFAIKSSLQQLLYEKPNHKLQQEMEAILKEHKAATGSTGFLYKGKFFGQRTRTAPKPLESTYLVERMEALLADDRELNTEKAYVESYINAILNSSTYVSTYMALLPSVAHDILRKVDSSAVPAELSEEQRKEILRFNESGEKLFKQRILKNTVID